MSSAYYLSYLGAFLQFIFYYTTSVDSFHYDNLLKVCLFNHLGAWSGKCNQYLGKLKQFSLWFSFHICITTVVITDTTSGVRGIRKQEGRVGRKEKDWKQERKTDGRKQRLAVIRLCTWWKFAFVLCLLLRVHIPWLNDFLYINSNIRISWSCFSFLNSNVDLHVIFNIYCNAFLQNHFLRKSKD